MKKTQLFTIIALLLTLPLWVSAQNYLVNIPGLTSGNNIDFNDYINAVYALFISLAALLAVVKLIIAGVKYMFSDVVTQKSDAKKDIRGALLGLVVVLAAVLILSVINPNLTRFQLDIDAAPVPRANQPAVTAAQAEQNTIANAQQRAEQSVDDEIIPCVCTGGGRGGGNCQERQSVCNAELQACADSSGVGEEIVNNKLVYCERSNSTTFPCTATTRTVRGREVTSYNCDAAVDQCTGQGEGYDVVYDSTLSSFLSFVPPSARG